MPPVEPGVHLLRNGRHTLARKLYCSRDWLTIRTYLNIHTTNFGGGEIRGFWLLRLNRHFLLAEQSGGLLIRRRK